MTSQVLCARCTHTTCRSWTYRERQQVIGMCEATKSMQRHTRESEWVCVCGEKRNKVTGQCVHNFNWKFFVFFRQNHLHHHLRSKMYSNFRFPRQIIIIDGKQTTNSYPTLHIEYKFIHSFGKSSDSNVNLWIDPIRLRDWPLEIHFYASINARPIKRSAFVTCWRTTTMFVSRGRWKKEDEDEDEEMVSQQNWKWNGTIQRAHVKMLFIILCPQCRAVIVVMIIIIFPRALSHSPCRSSRSIHVRNGTHVCVCLVRWSNNYV